MLKKLSVLIVISFLLFLLVGLDIGQAKTCAEALHDCLSYYGYGESLLLSAVASAICYPGYYWCIMFIE